jgi:hypothetical protein
VRILGAAAVSLVALVLLGAAGGAMVTGTPGPDRLVGTAGPDVIRARGGDDTIDARDGADLLDAGTGSDRVGAGGGADRVVSSGDGADTVACGAGRDLVNADLADRVANDCEIVTRALSRDRLTGGQGQHETEVEPDSFSWGRTIVTAFQVGRFEDGGAMDIGWATSRNAGATWRAGTLPRLSVHSRPAGTAVAVADSAVAYDARHKTWLIVSLAGSEPASESEGGSGRGTDRILVSRSATGVKWNAPVTAVRGEEIDKPWIACDNWASSRFRGRCYVSYLDVDNGLIMTARSGNGGKTWSRPVGFTPSPGEWFRNGAQPVALPSGALIVLYSSFGSFSRPDIDHIAAVRSTDGGASFSGERFVAPVGQRAVLGMRTVAFPSVETDAAGRMYVVWQDCQPSGDCSANDVVLSTSIDGINWTAPRSVPTGRTDASTQYFLPAVGVDRTTRGARARLAVAFYSLASCEPSSCPGVEALAVASSNGGASWSVPTRLGAEQMAPGWIAESSIGRMLADYISVSWVGGHAVPVFALARPPSGRSLRQSIFATARGVR